MENMSIKPYPFLNEYQSIDVWGLLSTQRIQLKFLKAILLFFAIVEADREGMNAPEIDNYKEASQNRLLLKLISSKSIF